MPATRTFDHAPMLDHDDPLAKLAICQDADGESDCGRLSRCHLCLECISPTAQLFMLDDLPYCCASHRAAAAAGPKGAIERAKATASPLRVRQLATGVGLAASHRSWFSLDDLVSTTTNSTTSATSSVASSVASDSPKGRPRRETLPLRIG